MKYITITLLLFCVHSAFSQEYMDKIVVQSCECLGKVPDNLEGQQYNMELGLCMIEASMPYKKQLKKDYDVNLDEIETNGEKLGRVIGMKMATVCPAALVKVTQKNQKSNKGSEDQTTQGTITKVDSDFFVAFHVRDESGKTMKYYWLTHIDSQQELTSGYTEFVGKSVAITFESKDFFDPKIQEYRPFFLIKKLEFQ